MSTKTEQITNEMITEWRELLIALQGEIADDYRCTDDPEDDQPGMCVTIGFTPETPENSASWSYQTGDNSYTGGAYSHPHWAVVYLYRDSDCAGLADDAASQIYDLLN